MNKRISIIFIVFIFLGVISMSLLLFLKFDNYIASYLLKKDNNTYVLLNKNEYAKLKNKKYLTFKLDGTNYESKILSYAYDMDNCFLTLNLTMDNIRDINKINIFINRTNLFGWSF